MPKKTTKPSTQLNTPNVQINYSFKALTPIKAPNAPRSPPPKWFKSESLDFSNEYVQTQDDIAVCKNLAGIASRVLRRPIKIFMRTEVEGVTYAHTDGRDIYIPKNHPHRRIATKHELAHLYFNSNIPLRLLFVQDLVESLPDKDRLDEGTRSQLVNDLCFLINIFDDIRVNSLWGVLYPGDGRDMANWYFGDVAPRMEEKALEHYEGDINKLFIYVILVSLGRDVPSTKWGKFKEKIQSAADSVHFKTFHACLLICKNLLLEICKQHLKDLAEQESPNPTERKTEDPELQKAEGESKGFSPSEDIDKSIKDRLGKKESIVDVLKEEASTVSPPNFADDNAGFDFQTAFKVPKPKEYKEDFKYLNELQKKSIEEILEEEEDAALEMLRDIQESLDNVPAYQPSALEHFSENVQGVVEVVTLRASGLPGSVRPDWVRDVGRQWNLFFRHVACLAKNREEEFGSELIPDLYIQKRLQREPLEVFRNSSTGLGFRATILVDLSGSMKQALTQVEILLQVLRDAFDFPYAQINVLGFNSCTPGITTIYEYDKSDKTVAGGINPRGLTPLPQAIRYAGNALSSHPEHSHLLVLSDGYPRFFTRDSRAVHLKALMSWTREAVHELIHKKVNIHCIMLGSDVEDTDLEWMFGPHWTRAYIPTRIRKEEFLDQDNDFLTTSIFEFLKTQFVRYLKVR